MAVFREWSIDKQQDDESRDQIKQIKGHLTSCLPMENHATLM